MAKISKNTWYVLGGLGVGAALLAYYWPKKTVEAMPMPVPGPSPLPPSMHDQVPPVVLSPIPVPGTPARPGTLVTGPGFVARANGLDVRTAPGGAIMRHIAFRTPVTVVRVDNNGWALLSDGGWVCSTCDDPLLPSDIATGSNKPWIRPPL